MIAEKKEKRTKTWKELNKKRERKKQNKDAAACAKQIKIYRKKEGKN